MSAKVLLILMVLLCLTAIPAFAGTIHQAALMGDLAKIQTLAKLDSTLVNERDENGLTPIFWCVYADQPKAACKLIELKADVDAIDESKETPLHVAVTLGSLEMVETLISAGARVDLEDDNGSTPLALAKRIGKPEIVDALLGKKQTITIPAPRLETPQLASSSLEVTKITLPTLERNPGAKGSKAVVLSKVKIKGIPINLLTIDLSDSRVSISAAIAQNGIETDEQFSSFVKRCAPTAAVNGTFFSKTSLRPIGDIVINGKLAHWGGMGTALCLTKDCRPQIVTVERHKHIDWSAYKTVICGGGRLLTGGSVRLDPASEGFKDVTLLGRSNRTAAGITSANKLLLVNTAKSITLDDWANIMKSLGCVDAVNFDGGTSMAMYYRGKMISKAGRKLTNVLLVYEK
ncbi:MAG: phosphodiester glycosidase family protein [Armatimonadetes bacterium]|nr:phosphodiester glycosidase family protein [Armatimonadota bacterium]